MASMDTGVLLFAHGSRDARWREPVEAVARRMQQLQPSVPVLCAYLELVAPDLPTAAATLIGDGVRTVRVVPLFLGMGKHVREDLPKLLDDLRGVHPAVEFVLSPAVGEDAGVVDLLARIALRA